MIMANIENFAIISLDYSSKVSSCKLMYVKKKNPEGLNNYIEKWKSHN